MKWNWQQKDWPHFRYETKVLKGLEEQFLHRSGLLFGAYKHISDEEKETLTVDLICNEALKTSEIEGNSSTETVFSHPFAATLVSKPITGKYHRRSVASPR